MDNNRTFMTLKNRALMKSSMVHSPADAVERVASIAKAQMSDLITKEVSNIGEFLDGTCKYVDYCGRLKAETEENQRRAKSPYKSEYGNSVSDKVLTLTFLLATLPERFRYEKPQLFFDLTISLGDYLNALIDLSFNADGTMDIVRVERYRRLKEEFSKTCSLRSPLCDVIGDILEQYRESRLELDRTSHIINCDSQVKYSEQEREMREEWLDNECYPSSCENDYFPPERLTEPVEVDETGLDDVPCAENISPISFVNEEDSFEGICFVHADPEEYAQIMAEEQLINMDPVSYYLSMARELPKGTGLDLKSGSFRADGLLLMNEDYTPEAFKARADKAELYPCFRELFDELVTEKSVADAFKSINAVISKLYRLLVEPFAEIGKYHFERHIAGGI